ncbi:MAG: hypothetical protein EXR72_24845 [Myxococcales bacterium]|nr:hypothetical protein [Myxococcales bacterium]
MRRGAAACLLIAGLAARAGAERTYGVLAEVTGGPGWRTSIGQDAQAPGFDAITGGADVLLGLDVGGSVGILLGGRIRGGTVSGASYLEAAGDIGAQIRVGERVRLRAGFDAGRAFIDWRKRALVVGGWTSLGFDLLTYAGGRVAMSLTIRLDIGAFPGAAAPFPSGTLALCAGLGWRY